MANREIRDYPDYTGASNEGYLIVGGKTSNVSGGKILLSDIGGGGGGGSDVVYLDLTIQLVDGSFHLTSASMTPQDIMTAIESGKYVIARTFKYKDNVITHSTQLTLGDYYNGAPYGDGYIISFGAAGSGFWDANTPYIAILTTRGSLEWVSSGLWEVSDLDE